MTNIRIQYEMAKSLSFTQSLTTVAKQIFGNGSTSKQPKREINDVTGPENFDASRYR